jgi:hypothetical protein
MYEGKGITWWWRSYGESLREKESCFAGKGVAK